MITLWSSAGRDEPGANSGTARTPRGSPLVSRAQFPTPRPDMNADG